MNADKYATPNQTLDCSYSINIDSMHNDEANPTTIVLSFNIRTSQDSPTDGSANLILSIATVMHPDIIYGKGVVLHPDFPASETIGNDRQISFGKRFGILF